MTVDLSHLEDDYGAAEEKKATSFDPVPDGKYTVEVTGAEVTTSKSGSPLLKWTLKIVGGPFDGRMLWRNNMLSSGAQLGWLKTDLARCDIHLAKVNDLNTRAGELVGLCLAITQKTNGQYANVYIDRLLSQAEVDALPANDSGLNNDPSSTLPF